MIVLLLTGLVLLACGATVWWAQPLSGDLTRIGAWPERWFGWQTPQQKMMSVENAEADPRKPLVLVVGDSFSDAGFWQAYLADHYRFVFVHINTIDMATLPARIAREHADAVVIEAVERTFDDVFGAQGSFQFSALDGSCEIAPTEASTAISAQQLADLLAALPDFPLVNRHVTPDSPEQLTEGFHYLKTRAKLLVKPKKRKAVALELTRHDLFSSRVSDRVLVLPGDALLKKSLPESQVQSINCALQHVASRLQQLHLPFAIVAVPDKSSAYQSHLADEVLHRQPLLIRRVQPERVPHTINLLPALQQMIEQGQQDVYLPDDSHWGYRGFRMAAAVIKHELSVQERH